MAEKRFTLEETDWSYRIRDNGAVMKIPKIVDLLNRQVDLLEKYALSCEELDYEIEQLQMRIGALEKENGQLAQQLQIFEEFLEGNNLSIDWEEFCGLEECAFENPDFSCKSCIHLKGDV